MNDNIDTIVENAKVELKGARNTNLVLVIENKYVGPTGLLTRSLKSANQLPKNFKEVRIRAIENALRKVERFIDKRKKELKQV